MVLEPQAMTVPQEIVERKEKMVTMELLVKMVLMVLLASEELREMLEQK